ncbi:MAG: flagellar basal body protein [Desulfuromonadaceae bacterium]|nr:flagellar basal body protein [Desulfuromonadaceae bacterium]MDD2855470.1 flagellar basal body protein [Desulfuromonadaceae bacterium]
MENLLSTSLSALNSFSTSQAITANNLANLNTDGFKASKAVFQENVTSGVTVTSLSTDDTVDISREAANLILNSQGFKANLEVLKTSIEMSKEILSIKA